MNELIAETATIETEIGRIQADNAAFTSYQTRYESVMNEVRSLEGQLADLNLALDKSRTQTNVEDVKAQTNRLKQTNAIEQSRVDALFVKATAAQHAYENNQRKHR